MNLVDEIEGAEGLSEAEIREGQACARESGWPDELYFGLFGLALRARGEG